MIFALCSSRNEFRVQPETKFGFGARRPLVYLEEKKKKKRSPRCLRCLRPKIGTHDLLPRAVLIGRIEAWMTYNGGKTRLS